MTPQEVRDYFKTTYRFRAETGMSTASLVYWEKCGYIPAPSQLFLEDFTNGELTASLADIPKLELNVRDKRSE